jgi:hypothetical protein
VVTPLRGEANRFFDYQIGLRMSYFFGPTARDRTRAAYARRFDPLYVGLLTA